MSKKKHKQNPSVDTEIETPVPSATIEVDGGYGEPNEAVSEVIVDPDVAEAVAATEAIETEQAESQVVEPQPEPVPPLTPQVSQHQAAAMAGVTITPQTPTVADGRMGIVMSNLAIYESKMRPGRPVEEVEGVQMQRLLWNSVKEVLNLEGPDFFRGYNQLLDYVSQYRNTVFHERYIFRFMQDLSAFGMREATNFQRFMSLLMATCDRASRRLGLRQVSLEVATRDLDGHIRAKLEQFYEDGI